MDTPNQYSGTLNSPSQKVRARRVVKIFWQGKQTVTAMEGLPMEYSNGLPFPLGKEEGKGKGKTLSSERQPSTTVLCLMGINIYRL